MNPLILGAVASFVLGATGYIIVQFWLRPIWRYTRLKRRIQQCLPEILQGQSPVTPPDQGPAGDRRLLYRRHAAKLNESFHDDLPHWYRMLLQNRREDPLKAAEHLMNLSNIRNPRHAAARAEKIRICLKLMVS